MFKDSWHGTLYLGYLTLLPALGTYVAFGVFKLPIPPLLYFFLGTAGASVMLAFSASYTKLSERALPNLLRLIDTPAWILFGQFFGASAADAIFQIVFSEMAGIMLGIMVLACVSSVPTTSQKWGTLLVLGLPLLGIIGMGVLYVQSVSLPLWSLLFLIGGTGQSAVSQFLTAREDTVQRPSEGFILVGMGLFIVALIIGAVQGGYN